MSAIALVLTVAVAAAGNPQTLIGNGHLTAVVDGYGSVSVCRWPGPGMNNQVGGGTKWGISEKGKVTWFGENGFGLEAVEPWRPGLCTGRVSRGLECEVVTETFVSEKEDVLIWRLKAAFTTTPADFLWYADFSPRTAVLPELAVIRDLQSDDFAAYVKDGRIYQFRPNGPGSKELRAAVNGDWDAFAESEGVWIVMASPQAVKAECGLAGGDRSAKGPGAASAVGDCDCGFLLTTGSGGEAVVFAAFGKTRAEAERALDRVMKGNSRELLDRAAASWAAFATQSTVVDERVAQRLEKDLAVLGMSVDGSTGAFTRDPVQGLCYLRDSAWASMALDLAGREEEAGRVLAFAASTVRREQRRGKPVGSLPVAVYGDGTEALPHVALDADAPGYVLGAIWKHAAAVKDLTKRMEFLESVWPEVSLMADFLVGWTDSRDREPLYSFDMSDGRDRQKPEQLLTTYMGIDAGMRTARATIRLEPEDWARRKVELDALIRFRLVDRQSKTWKPGPILPYWHDLMAEDWAQKGLPLPSWDAAVEDLLRSGGAGAEAAAGAALVWGKDGAHAEEVNAAVDKAYAEASDLNGLNAAQRVIADFGLRSAD